MKRTHILALLALWSAGCAPVPQATLTIAADPATTSAIKSIEVSTGNLLTTTGQRLEVSALGAGTVNIRVTTADGSPATVGGTAAPSGEWVALKLAQLDKATTVPVAAAGDTVQLATLPADFPDYTVKATTPKPGIVCLTANSSDTTQPSYLIITDELGHPIYYKKLPDQGYNLQQHTAPDGSKRYSYIQREGDQIPNVQAPLGTVHLMDANYQDLSQIRLLPYGDHDALPADVHEFIYLADDHYILISALPKPATDVPGQVAAAIIQEVQAGKVVMEWDSSKFPEFYANASDGNAYADGTIADYMHMNSVAIDPADNNLIVSFRHQDEVCKLDRKTGQILWRLGGKTSDFPLTAEQQFSHQHFGRITGDGTLTLFDNGNATQKTRLLTFKLDQASKTVTSFKSFEPEARYSAAMGDYQPLDATSSFVGWGAKGTATTDAAEFGADGHPTFTLGFTNTTYNSYRSLKYLTP